MFLVSFTFVILGVSDFAGVVFKSFLLSVFSFTLGFFFTTVSSDDTGSVFGNSVFCTTGIELSQIELTDGIEMIFCSLFSFILSVFTGVFTGKNKIIIERIKQTAKIKREILSVYMYFSFFFDFGFILSLSFCC